MKGITETVRFINMLYAGIETGFAEIRMFNSDGHIKRFYRPLTDGPAQSERLSGLQTYNDAGYNIFLRIGISETRHSRKEDIACLPALWVDIDNPNESAYELLTATTPTPNIIIATGGGWHGYWILEEPLLITTDNRAEIEQVLRGIALYYGGDVKVADVARIMRLPGFSNNKYEHKPVAYNADGVWDDKRYHYAEIAQIFKPLGEPARLAPQRNYRPPVDGQYINRYVQNYLTMPVGRGERNQRLYVAARFYRDAGRVMGDALAELGPKAQGDGLKAFEIERTVNSAYHSTPGMIIGRHIEQISMAINDKRRNGVSPS